VNGLDLICCERPGLKALEPGLNQLALAAAKRGQISFPDHLYLLVAPKSKFICVTSDKPYACTEKSPGPPKKIKSEYPQMREMLTPPLSGLFRNALLPFLPHSDSIIDCTLVQKAEQGMQDNTALYCSGSIESLAAKLAEAVQECEDPFKPSLILVPNGNLRKWLKLYLARQNGAVAGTDIRFLETGLNARFFGEEQTEVLTDDKLAILIHSLLSSQLIAEKELSPFVDYFAAKGTLDSSRRWQLAVKLARLFRDYSLHRHDYTDNWLKGETSFGDIDDQISAAQAMLYRELFKKQGLLDRVNNLRTEALPLAAIFQGQQPEAGEGTPIHVFGFSSISDFHMHGLATLAGSTKLAIYLLSLWEKADNQETPDILKDTRKSWGRVSLGAEKLINTHFKRNPVATGREQNRPSVLTALQEALLTGKTPATALRQDQSLQITGCPGIFREVETVFNSILFNMEEDEDLELTDIAVLTTSIQHYLAALQSVFSELKINGKRLPYNLSDSNAYEESLFGQALLNLLALADNGLSRRDVFNLIRNPVIQAGRKVSEPTTEIWARWTEELQIFRESKDSGRSWRFGLQRLRLGHIFATDSNDPVCLQGRLPYRNIDSSNTAAISKFSSFIDDLLQLHEQLRQKERNAEQWKIVIMDLMGNFLAIPPERPQEIRVMREMESALDELLLSDTAAEAVDCGQQLPAAVIRDFLTRKLKGLPVTRGQYLTGGVTISSLLPMRPVPFKIVYILGLQESQFPGGSSSSILDLRTREKTGRPEDVTVPELNRALFLETLLCTRKKIYLSFINRDLQKDREFFPCSILTRLKSLIEEILLSDDFLITHAPLKGYSVAYLHPDTAPNDTGVNYNPYDRLLCLKRLTAQHRLQPLVKEEALIQKNTENISVPAEKREPQIHEETTLSLKELTAFLINPGRARLKRFIRAKIAPGEDSSLLTHPELSSGYVVRDRLFDVMMQELLSGRSPLEGMQQYYTRQLKDEQLIPEGAFRNLDWKKLEEEFSTILTGTATKTGLADFITSYRTEFPYCEQARLSGKDTESITGIFDIHLNSIPITNGQTVRLVGNTGWLRRNENNSSWQFLTRSSGGRGPFYSSLQEILFSLCAAAFGDASCSTPVNVVIEKDGVSTLPLNLGSINSAKYITTLISDYLTPTPPEALPLRGILSLLKRSAGRGKPITASLIHEQSSGFKEKLETYLYTTDNPGTTGYDEYLKLCNATVPDNTEAVLLRRLLPLYQLQDNVRIAE